MGANEGRGRTAAARVREVSTPELYRRNPFRIVGLTAAATRREVRERRLRVLGVLEVGGAVPDGVPADATVDEVRAAFDALGNTEHRLVDEVFWTWGMPADCECPLPLHRAHDNAVAAYAAALDAEADRTDDHPTPLWTEAARCWTAVLRSESFWRHLNHRVEKLGDRRLDESTVDGLRTALPDALLAPLIEVATRSAEPRRFTGYLALFGADRHAVEDARAAIADGTYRRVEALLKELRGDLDGNRVQAAAERAIEETAPLLDRLEEVVPRAEFRRTASLSESIAVVANNIGVALAEVRGGPASLIREVFAVARRCSRDPETLEAVARNEVAATADVPAAPPGREPSAARIFGALLHAVAATMFLAFKLPEEVFPAVMFLGAAPAALTNCVVAARPWTTPGRYPALLGLDFVVYLALSPVELPYGVAIAVAAALLYVAPFVRVRRSL
ncbi:hypothetical protein G3I59_05755 [Amycolatopsis rubida]|uniref:Uncharacterized protein n=1 Tax=Amycolatopsis rubida TaxID=112413 RepID=A0ABX0BL62_9PSEU|nr:MULTISPECIES: hypothetical protein [Amycolatopsis]MYW90138.1 hypothetical protein [Amycolatopsis rubida]NEC55115.1 hypothetical protein [Amycolatopsis rubida]OAP28603.1 hypothetical protein A4R44_00394 [Amycolatopsis sp. M39]